MDKVDDENIIQKLIHAIMIEDEDKMKEGLLGLEFVDDPRWLEGYNLLCTAYKNKKYQLADRFLKVEFFQVNNELEENENTPLHWAIINRSSDHHLESIKNLLNRGADINRKNSLDQNSFDLVLQGKDLAVLDLLVDHINDENINKKTYLKLFFDLIKKDYVKLAEKLLAKCTHINIEKSMGDFNYLILAVEKKQYNVIKSLLGRGMDVNYYDKSNVDSVTALFKACIMGDFKMVKFLLDHGADMGIETMAYFRQTLCYYPIHIAIIYIGFQGRNEIFNIVKEFLDRGENVDRMFFENVCKESRDQKTGLHLACRNNNLDIVKLLVERGANINSGSINAGMPILEAFGDENSPDDDQEIEVITYLLGLENLRLNLATADSMFLYGAKFNKYRKMNLIFEYIKRLNPKDRLRYDLDINVFNNGNLNQPLIHIASRYSYKESIELFIKNDIDVNLTNPKGRTALHVAFRYRQHDSIINLIRNGANINLVCNDGLLPVEYTFNDKIRESRFDTDDDDEDDGIEDLDDFFEDDLHKISNYFRHHVIKLKHLKLFVNDNNDNFATGNLKNPPEHQDKYGKEARKMKKEIISRDIPYINYFDFAKASLNCRINCLNHPQILDILSSQENYSTMFPEFADIISNLFHQALARKKLLDKFYDYPIFEFLNKSLPHLCVIEVIKCFSNSELRDVVNKYTFFH